MLVIMHPVLHHVAVSSARSGILGGTAVLPVPQGEQDCTLLVGHLAPLRVELPWDCKHNVSYLPVQGSKPISMNKNWVLRPTRVSGCV